MTLKGWAGIRAVRFGAACALGLMCAWVPAANARPQSASGDSAANKTAAKAKSSPRKHSTAASKASASTSGTKSTATTASAGKRGTRKKKSARARGQQKIDSERAQAIQEALIREHYLSGEASGTWNQASEEAMRRYLDDHGWQTKEVPDSRALIKLGLGPSKDHLLNPESAMTTVPDAPRVVSSDLPAPAASPAPGKDRPLVPVPAPSSGPNDSPDPQ